MKFKVNNHSVSELFEVLGGHVKRFEVEEWDQEVFYAIQEELPLKPITFIKTILVSDGKLEIGKTNYEIIDGEQILSTLFSFIDSIIFSEKPAEYREKVWKFSIGTTESKRS